MQHNLKLNAIKKRKTKAVSALSYLMQRAKSQIIIENHSIQE